VSIKHSSSGKVNFFGAYNFAGSLVQEDENGDVLK